MEVEHCKRAGSKVEFWTTNYGIRTTPNDEWQLVVTQQKPKAEADMRSVLARAALALTLNCKPSPQITLRRMYAVCAQGTATALTARADIRSVRAALKHRYWLPRFRLSLPVRCAHR